MTDTEADIAARNAWIHDNVIDPQLTTYMNYNADLATNGVIDADDGPLSNIDGVKVDGDEAWVVDCLAYQGRQIIEGDLTQRSAGGYFEIVQTSFIRRSDRWLLTSYGGNQEQCDPTRTDWDLSPDEAINPQEFAELFEDFKELFSTDEDEIGYDGALAMVDELATDPWRSAITQLIEGRRTRGEYVVGSRLEGELIAARQWGDKITLRACVNYTRAEVEREPDDPTGEQEPTIWLLFLRQEHDRWWIEQFNGGGKPCER